MLLRKKEGKMRKVIHIVTLSVLILLIFPSCQTFTSDYYVDGEYYISQGEKDFGKPADPPLSENRIFEGWSIEGSDEVYTTWDEMPEGDVRFDAVITDIVEFYVDGRLWKSIPFNQLDKDPGMPYLSSSSIAFRGWKPEGSDEVIMNWEGAKEGVLRYDAFLVPVIRFYVNGELWASTLQSEEYRYPGEPDGRIIPRGYKFIGWAAADDYDVYDGDLEKEVPKKTRFDALLAQNTVESGINDADEDLILNLERDIEILGPVIVEESYEIVDGKVRVGGIGYNDLLKAAIELYPQADQVINIITDYETIDYTIDTGNTSSGKTFPKGERTITFEVASYTGIAINIK